jgi:hypothetical protein
MKNMWLCKTSMKDQHDTNGLFLTGQQEYRAVWENNSMSTGIDYIVWQEQQAICCTS